MVKNNKVIETSIRIIVHLEQHVVGIVIIVGMWELNDDKVSMYLCPLKVPKK